MAKNEEVDIGDDSEDYEVVPMGPVRRLEKRVDSIQEQAQNSGQTNPELIRDVLDIMKSNQKIVNDMTESTHELKNSVEDLTHKMDEVVDNMNSFMDLLKDASEVDMEGEIVGDMQGRIADAIGDRMDDVIRDMHESNREIVDSLEDLNKTIRRSYASQNKGDVRRRSRSGSKQQQAQQDRGRGRRFSNRSQPGQNNAQSDMDQNSPDDQRSERMRKLRSRMNASEDEQ